MQLTPAALEAIYYNFNLAFQQAYATVPTWYQQLCTTMPSTTRSERYAWMKRIPAFREWLGERYFNNVVARAYEIVNKDWEDSLEIDRNDIEDDRLGVFAPALQMLGQQAARWPDDVMGKVIQDADAALCYDGQFFFDTDHPVDMDKSALGTFSNSFNLALTLSNVSTVRAAMASYLGEDGKPLMINPTLIVVPPQLRDTAAQICNATFVAPVAAFGINAAGGFQENVLRGSYTYLEIPQLANEPTVWYLLDVSKPLKPFIWQLRKSPQFVSMTDPQSPNVFYHRKFQYGVDSRGNGGYGLPWLAARSAP